MSKGDRMKYEFLIIITLFIGACSGSGSSNNSSEEEITNLVVTTIDQDGESFSIENLSYSQVSDPEIEVVIDCESSCILWEFPDNLSGGINVTAQTIIQNTDPYCSEITYEGEVYIDVDPTAEQDFELVLYQLPYVCQ
jgi:hypothetical protein